MTSYSGTVEGNMIEIRKNDWSDDVERECIPCIAFNSRIMLRPNLLPCCLPDVYCSWGCIVFYAKEGSGKDVMEWIVGSGDARPWIIAGLCWDLPLLYL
jgi:hypothetical protein